MDARAWRWSVAGAGLLAAAAFIYVFPPDRYGFYPRCLFLTFTGLTCPGCGGLRAVHHLLHGDVVTAFHLNPFAVVCLPLGALLAAISAIARVSPERFIKPIWIWLLVGLGVLFGIVRNFSSASGPNL